VVGKHRGSLFIRRAESRTTIAAWGVVSVIIVSILIRGKSRGGVRVVVVVVVVVIIFVGQEIIFIFTITVIIVVKMTVFAVIIVALALSYCIRTTRSRPGPDIIRRRGGLAARQVS